MDIQIGDEITVHFSAPDITDASVTIKVSRIQDTPPITFFGEQV